MLNLLIQKRNLQKDQSVMTNHFIFWHLILSATFCQDFWATQNKGMTLRANCARWWEVMRKKRSTSCNLLFLLAKNAKHQDQPKVRLGPGSVPRLSVTRLSVTRLSVTRLSVTRLSVPDSVPRPSIVQILRLKIH